MNDRYLAYKILNKIEHDKSYSNITVDAALNSEGAVSAHFVSALVYGVIERKLTIDYMLSKYLTKPLKKLNPQVLTVLRLGTYQIKYMDKVPNSAAVNECVKLLKKTKFSYASGLVNSVLRKISENEIELPDTDDFAYNLSIKYSCNKDIVEHYIEDYGLENTENVLKESIGSAPFTIRVNTLKVSEDELVELLLKENIEAVKTDLENCLVIKNSGDIFKTNCYKKGFFHIQDMASQICINTLSPCENDTVFDMCAAPGGKSFTIAEYMKNKGNIYSFDLYEQRVNLINDGAKNLGINIITGKVADASQYNKDLPMADKILCDVPCSGLGVIRRKPEIKYKDIGFIDKLCDLQYNIIDCASKYLKSGGALVYSTCSLNKKENQYICDKFLSNNPSFTKVSLSEDDGYLTLMPHKNHTDGFFIAKFYKG